MDELDSIYKLNKYFYINSDKKIIKYKKYCIISDCKKNASFNYKNMKDPIYCNVHKLKNMINVKKMLINLIVYYAINIFLKNIIFLENI